MAQPGNTPIYSVRGAQPRPTPGGKALRSSWRGSMIVVMVMFGWMMFTFALAALAAPNDPNIEVPIPLDRGVIVNPADGWYDASEDWDVQEGAVSLQKSGVYVAFWAIPYVGTNRELLRYQLPYLEQDFKSHRTLPASDTTVAGDIPGLAVLVNGVSDIWGPENELVVASSAGTGLVVLATAPAGQLARMQGDIDLMLRTLVMPR